MLLSLIALHFALGVTAAWWVRLLGRNAFLVVAIAPAIGFGWLLTLAPAVQSGSAFVEATRSAPMSATSAPNFVRISSSVCSPP